MTSKHAVTSASAGNNARPFAILAKLSFSALLCFGFNSAYAQTALDAVDHTRGVVSENERALIKAQVLHVVDNYYAYFSSGQTERIPVETHMVPYIFLGTGTANPDAGEIAKNYAKRRQGVLNNLDSDYEKSTYTPHNVCVLSASAAITSGINTRTNTKGGIVSVEGVSYILTKTPQGWRIAAFSPTLPGLVIRCTDESA